MGGASAEDILVVADARQRWCCHAARQEIEAELVETRHAAQPRSPPQPMLMWRINIPCKEYLSLFEFLMVYDIKIFIPHIAMESNGYATVANSIAQDPDNETYVFRRFDRLTARNLLTIQGELLALQHELDVLDSAAALSTDPGLHVAMRSWTAMHTNIPDGNGRDDTEKEKRVQIAAQLEVKLKRYRESPGGDLCLSRLAERRTRWQKWSTAIWLLQQRTLF